MRRSFGILASVCLIALSSCTGGASPEDIGALEAMPVCCKSYAEFPYQQIALPYDDVVSINQDSPVFNFASGKSHFAMLKLPASERAVKIEITSYFNFGGTFDPSVMVLNAQFETTYKLSGSDIDFLPQGAFTPARKAATLVLDPKKRGDAYIIFYTTMGSLTSRSVSKETVSTTTAVGVIPLTMSGRPETGHKTTGRIYLKAYAM